MAELGIDLLASGAHPKRLDEAAVKASDVVITMGCGDECPFYPGTRYLDWKLDDPAGQGVDAIRPIRDEIDRRVRDLLAELIQEAELPDGVVNIITGAGATGAALVNHPGIDKIAFTGSTGVGKLIQKSIAGTGKKATLELGGKAANIIFADATIDQAVEGIINGIYFNQGHVCCAGSRLFVEEGVYDEVIRKLKHRMRSLVVGDPLDKNTDIGAINAAVVAMGLTGFWTQFIYGLIIIVSVSFFARMRRRMAR